MSKLGLVLAAVLILLLGALPPVLGGLTKSQVEARVAAIDSHPMVSATVTDYDRGWFQSAARIEIGWEYPAAMVAADGPPTRPPGPMPIAVEIAHGPVAIGDDVHFGWSSFVARLDPDDPTTQTMLERLNAPYVFEFRGRTGFDGTLRFDADVPAMEMNEPGTELTFTGATLDGSLAGRDLKWQLAADRLRVQAPDGTFTAERVTSSGDVELRSQYFVLGSAGLQLGGLQATGPFDAPMFEVADVRVESGWELDPSGELGTGTITYAVGSLAAPEVELTDATVRATAANVELAALEQYYDTMQRAVVANPATAPDELAAQLGPVLERALRRSPSLTVEPISFRWRNEPFDANVRVTIDGNALPPPAAFDPTNPLLLVGAMRLDARATLSKVLAQDLAVQIISTQMAMTGGGNEIPPDQIEYMAGAQAGLMLVSLVGQGYLIDDGQSYTTELTFADGTLTINGNPLALPLP